MSKVLSEIARVEQRANIKANEYLEFGNDANKELKYYNGGRYHRIGE